jgi:hypothetical protein
MRRNWGAYAPTPFVGAAVLLLALIVLTPVLVSSGQPAPGVLTQAELIVDQVPGSNVTHFYVRAPGLTVRYAGLWVGLAVNFTWDGSGHPVWASLNWSTWWNSTDILSFSFASSDNPVAVNITAYYTSGSATATYVGVVAFAVGTGSGGGGVLYADSPTTGVTVPSSTPIDNSSLPLPILLALGTSGQLP